MLKKLIFFLIVITNNCFSMEQILDHTTLEKKSNGHLRIKLDRDNALPHFTEKALIYIPNERIINKMVHGIMSFLKSTSPKEAQSLITLFFNPSNRYSEIPKLISLLSAQEKQLLETYCTDQELYRKFLSLLKDTLKQHLAEKTSVDTTYFFIQDTSKIINFVLIAIFLFPLLKMAILGIGSAILTSSTLFLLGHYCLLYSLYIGGLIVGIDFKGLVQPIIGMAISSEQSSEILEKCLTSLKDATLDLNEMVLRLCAAITLCILSKYHSEKQNAMKAKLEKLKHFLDEIENP